MCKLPAESKNVAKAEGENAVDKRFETQIHCEMDNGTILIPVKKKTCVGYRFE